LLRSARAALVAKVCDRLDSSGPEDTSLTSEGHPHAVFRRAIDRQNLPMALVTAREVGRLTLPDALDLTALIAMKDPGRRSRVAVRWLRRLLDEDELVAIEQASFAAAALASPCPAIGSTGKAQDTRGEHPSCLPDGADRRKDAPIRTRNCWTNSAG
jgi:hypothetical protein